MANPEHLRLPSARWNDWRVQNQRDADLTGADLEEGSVRDDLSGDLTRADLSGATLGHHFHARTFLGAKFTG
jgi:uncharacterized protein YjbI with pentapeptide repeats